MKFKVGDRVRILKRDSPNFRKIGVVQSDIAGTVYEVILPDGRSTIQNALYLELYKGADRIPVEVKYYRPSRVTSKFRAAKELTHNKIYSVIEVNNTLADDKTFVKLTNDKGRQLYYNLKSFKVTKYEENNQQESENVQTTDKEQASQPRAFENRDTSPTIQERSTFRLNINSGWFESAFEHYTSSAELFRQALNEAEVQGGWGSSTASLVPRQGLFVYGTGGDPAATDASGFATGSQEEVSQQG